MNNSFNSHRNTEISIDIGIESHPTSTSASNILKKFNAALLYYILEPISLFILCLRIIMIHPMTIIGECFVLTTFLIINPFNFRFCVPLSAPIICNLIRFAFILVGNGCFHSIDTAISTRILLGYATDADRASPHKWLLPYAVFLIILEILSFGVGVASITLTLSDGSLVLVENLTLRVIIIVSTLSFINLLDILISFLFPSTGNIRAPILQPMLFKPIQTRPDESKIEEDLGKFTNKVSWKDKNLESNNMCSICLDEYFIGDEIVQIAVCSHVFHKDCYKEWLWRQYNCPLCKRTVIELHTH